MFRFNSNRSQHTELGVQVAHCDADTGRLGGDLPLGPANVWPPTHEICRHADNYVGRRYRYTGARAQNGVEIPRWHAQQNASRLAACRWPISRAGIKASVCSKFCLAWCVSRSVTKPSSNLSVVNWNVRLLNVDVRSSVNQPLLERAVLDIVCRNV